MNRNMNKSLCVQTFKKNFSTRPSISNINPHFKSEAHAQSATTKVRLAKEKIRNEILNRDKNIPPTPIYSSTPKFVKKTLPSDEPVSNNTIYNVQPIQSAAHKYREMRKAGQIDPLIGIENMAQNNNNKTKTNNNNANNSNESSSTWTSTGFVLLAAVITAGVWKYLQQTPSQSDAAIIIPYSTDNTIIKTTNNNNNNSKEAVNIIHTATIINTIDEIKQPILELPIVAELNSNQKYKQPLDKQPLWLQRKRSTRL